VVAVAAIVTYLIALFAIVALNVIAFTVALLVAIWPPFR
jgi:hypothetical protein